MIDDEISERAKSALRDYSADARLERVWRRLDSEFQRPARRISASLWLAPAAGVVLFGLGVFVGRHSLAPVAAPLAVLSAEPAQPVRPAAAGEPHVRAQQNQPPAAPSASDRRRAAPARAPLAAVAPANEEEPAPALAAVPSPAPSLGSETPEWQQKADAGEFKAARAALERAGGWDAAVGGASPDQLMTLVDVARASGEREPAVRALRRLLNGYADAPEAPLAAWTLGNLLEQGGDLSGAAEAYALYRRLSPTGDFAEDAAAREVDVALSAGNYEAALQLVEQYAKDFPAGRRLQEFREELQKLEAARAEGATAAGVEESSAAAPSGAAAPSAAEATGAPSTALPAAPAP